MFAGGMLGGTTNDPMTKKSRELYIGNLPEGVPEAQLMSFLNAALLQVSRTYRSCVAPYYVSGNPIVLM